jgi:methionyl-tRNA formyltransferase
MKTILFLGSKPVGYQCFLYLLQSQEALGVRVAGLLTQQRAEFSGEANLLALAGEWGIPVLDSPEEMPECDLIYSVQYHKILTAAQIAKAGEAAFNLHMAPLPEYRGASQFSFALLQGKTEFGTTIHIMDPRIDHGSILFEKRFPIPPHCWVEDLYRLTEAASVELFKDTLRQIITGAYKPVPQSVLECARGTSLHYKKEMAALKEIHVDQSPEALAQQLRAVYMPGFEPPYMMLAGEKIYFVRAADWNQKQRVL